MCDSDYTYSLLLCRSFSSSVITRELSLKTSTSFIACVVISVLALHLMNLYTITHSNASCKRLFLLSFKSHAPALLSTRKKKEKKKKENYAINLPACLLWIWVQPEEAKILNSTFHVHNCIFQDGYFHGHECVYISCASQEQVLMRISFSPTSEASLISHFAIVCECHLLSSAWSQFSCSQFQFSKRNFVTLWRA